MKVFVGCYRPKDTKKAPYTCLCFDLGYTVKKLFGVSVQDQAEILGVTVRRVMEMKPEEKIEVK